MLEENIDIKISKNQNQFSDLEVRLAEYIINNKVLIIDSNVSAVAQHCKVSDATVVRFAKKLGYSGFAELKISVAATISLKDTIGTFSESTHDPYKSIFENSVNTFQRTLSDLDKQNLSNIVLKIINSKSIFVVGVGSTYSVVLDLVYKLSKLGIKVFTSDIPEILITTCKNLEKEDLVIAVSHSGESQTVLHACDCAHQNNCDVVLITNFKKSPLTKIADYVVSTNVYSAERYSKLNIFTRLTEHFLIDLIYLLIESELERKLR